jgi:hypothetical protein
MTPTEANTVAAFAKGLFPVTSDERITSLAAMVLNFPNEAFARQCLLEHSQNSDVLSIPAVRGMLEADETRRRETAEQRAARAKAEQQAARDREDADRHRLVNGMRSVDELLNNLSDEDLQALKADVVAALPIPCLVNGDPKTSVALRRLIHYRLTGGQVQPRPQAVASNSVANLAMDFDA